MNIIDKITLLGASAVLCEYFKVKPSELLAVVCFDKKKVRRWNKMTKEVDAFYALPFKKRAEIVSKLTN